MKKFFFFSLVMMLSLGAYAQEETVVETQNKRGPYVTNGFWDNWFISVGGGAQIYWGGDDFHNGFWNQAKPAVDVAVGKWFLPTIGTRLQWSGIKAASWGKGNTLYGEDAVTGTALNSQEFNSSILHMDFMWHMSNAFGGYRADRFWNFIPYLGFGWGHSWNDDYYNNTVVANAGLLNSFTICPALNLNLDLRASAFNRRYDLYENARAFDYMTTATLGLSYNFAERSFKRASDLIVVDDNSEFINEINDLQDMLAKANAERDRYKDELEAARNQKPVVVEADPVAGNFAVFFNINSAAISEQGMINLGYAADAIKQTGKKYVLYASADKKTGTAEYNQKLSEKRAEAVKKALVDTFGVSEDQLEINAVGSSEQKFKGNNNNRVVIVEGNAEAKTADME